MNKHIYPSDFYGTEYQIRIRDIEKDSLHIKNSIDEILKKGFVNLFSPERLGILDLSTCEFNSLPNYVDITTKLLQKKWKDATLLILEQGYVNMTHKGMKYLYRERLPVFSFCFLLREKKEFPCQIYPKSTTH